MIEESFFDPSEGNSAESEQITQNPKPLIEEKFKFSKKSGLICFLQGKTTCDIIVTPAN